MIREENSYMPNDMRHRTAITLLSVAASELGRQAAFTSDRSELKQVE